ncbi:MAG: type II toxin-antitoxin system HicA family toxin [bacterium]
MNRTKLEKQLQKLGWWLKRHGSKHDIWTDGDAEEPIPRHNEINVYLAKKILKQAKNSKKRGDL